VVVKQGQGLLSYKAARYIHTDESMELAASIFKVRNNGTHLIFIISTNKCKYIYI